MQAKSLKPALSVDEGVQSYDFGVRFRFNFQDNGSFLFDSVNSKV